MKYAIISDAHANPLALKTTLADARSLRYPRSDLCSSYAIFDSSTASVCVRRLPFDFKSYITEMLKNDQALPDWLVEILLEDSRKEVV